MESHSVEQPYQFNMKIDSRFPTKLETIYDAPEPFRTSLIDKVPSERAETKETANFRGLKTEAAPQPIADALPFIRRILAPTDFSYRSETAIEYAIELARQMSAQLTLLHVVPEPSALDYNMGGFPPEQLEQAQKDAKEKLAEELAHAKLTLLEVDAKLKTGINLREEILTTAKEISADLIVISTHGYTGWKHLLLGSDAEKILEHAPCPVLVVR